MEIIFYNFYSSQSKCIRKRRKEGRRERKKGGMEGEREGERKRGRKEEKEGTGLSKDVSFFEIIYP